MRRKIILRSVIALVLLLGMTEIATRMSGITDVPAYAVNDVIGYQPEPDQAGRFLNKNSWAFNSKSMPTTEAWNPSKHPNVLLIGNSIVMGGNPYDQKDKLTPLMTKDTGGVFSIWPVATGGWTNVNEVVYLKRNPEVAKAGNFFLWEYMSGGLSGLALWQGDYVFPSHHPRWASWYAFRRYILPRFVKINMSELPPLGDFKESHLIDFEASLAELSKNSGLAHPGILFLYPTRKDLLLAKGAAEWLPERRRLQEICDRHGVKLIDLAADKDWNETLYRDGTHPTIEGNIVLAKYLSNALMDAFPPHDASSAHGADSAALSN